MSEILRLSDIRPGEYGRVLEVGGEGALRQHLLDMGLTPGAALEVIKYAPMGDPLELRIHGYELTLRLSEAECIRVERAEKAAVNAKTGVYKDIEHPGLGEYGKTHDKSTENPLPKTSRITFALAGNQNSGKTTLFNALTGSNQHVGNFPGVTVDRKDGTIQGHPETRITDLPGIYSLSPYTREEMVSRSFILDEKPSGIINILDATSIERGLYLTMQLMELNVPMVLALNMMDELRGNGGSVNINRMESLLGIPVVPISAAKGDGIAELVDHALHVAKYQERPLRRDFCSEDENGGAVHRAIHGIIHLIDDHARAAGIPARFAATKLIEGDEALAEQLELTQNEREMVEHIIVQMEEERGLDRAAAIADMRFSFIQNLVAESVTHPKESKERERSRRIDQVLTGKYTAIPAFILIMAAVFWLTFNVVGAWLQDLLDAGITALGDWVATAMASSGASPMLQSLVSEGIFAGVGSVLSFIPIIVILFFFLSMLEDSGYMARIAFITDRMLRKIGLSGRSIVPMLIGFGCSVPGIMAARTMPSERDRKITILLTPFMSCTAKLPIYGFLTAAFLPACAGLVMVSLYLLGIAVAILFAAFLKRSAFKGEAVPFVMELPNYRLPAAKNVARLLWDKAKDFLQRAFTIIFLASLVIWFLQHFDTGLNMVDDPETSILASVAGAISPVFAPLGFGTWKFSTALITGFMAKESVVATLTVLFGEGTAIASALTVPAAIALLVFCLLYTPCVAAIAAVKRELGAKWAAGVVVEQCVIAWIFAFLAKILFDALL
ncbi:MAG: ferrous iron transport protein B [Firmicutes bacterium]|nr:ferrous iron transport protein B [Bacillota bacterium]